MPSGFPMTDEQRRAVHALVTVTLRGDLPLAERLAADVSAWELRAALLLVSKVIGRANAEGTCASCLWADHLLGVEAAS